MIVSEEGPTGSGASPLLRHFEPAESSSRLNPASNLEHALGPVAAGWRVKPLKPGTKRQRTRAGTPPFQEQAGVRAHWHRWPNDGIGIMLNDEAVVVLDLDGQEGDTGLRVLLSRAGLSALPRTYTVTTGRAEGGRHLWFRLPDGVPVLRNQVGKAGTRYAESTGLDVLFNRLVAAVGTLHRSGTVYQSPDGPVPSRDQLAVLPSPLYEVLRKRGREADDRGVDHSGEQDTSLPARTGLAVSPAARLATGAPQLPQYVQRLLDDGSDGRTARCFAVVGHLLRLGWEEQQVIDCVLASVVGRKAREREPRRPESWVDRQIRSAQQARSLRVFDSDTWWWAVHTSGLSPAKVRVADALLRRASRWGTVTYSLGYLAIDSAVSSTSDLMKEMARDGYLRIQQAGDHVKPTVYRLTLRDQDEELNTQDSGLPSLPSYQSVLGVQNVVLPQEHDVFRARRGSLSVCYPLMSLLGGNPAATSVLAEALGGTPRALASQIDMLRRAGLVVVSNETLRLTAGPLRPLLDAAAVRAGTMGMREKAQEHYWEKARKRREAIKEAEVPGTDEWRRLRERDYLRNVQAGQYSHEAFYAAGNGDPNRLAKWLVEIELRHLIHGHEALERRLLARQPPRKLAALPAQATLGGAPARPRPGPSAQVAGSTCPETCGSTNGLDTQVQGSLRGQVTMQ